MPSDTASARPAPAAVPAPADDPRARGVVAYPHGPRIEDGGVAELRPGLFWIRLPLPFQLDHVNLWLLAEGDGWTVIDTGFGNETSRGHWGRLAAELLEGRPLRRVVATHHHPDHIGLAGWLEERFGAELWMSRTNWLAARMLQLDTGPRLVEVQGRFYERSGLGGEQAAEMWAEGNPYPRRVTPIPVQFRRLKDGDEVVLGGRRWQVIATDGHAPEHLCFYQPGWNLLVAGDQVLPRISPNVSVWAWEPEEDPLAAFLGSMATLARLPEDVLVLPSHGGPFVGLHSRNAVLAEHHAERLDAVAEAARTPVTTIDLLPVLFRRQLDLHQSRFAIGEALAHANHLVTLGRLERVVGDDGVLRFRAK